MMNAHAHACTQYTPCDFKIKTINLPEAIFAPVTLVHQNNLSHNAFFLWLHYPYSVAKYMYTESSLYAYLTWTFLRFECHNFQKKNCYSISSCRAGWIKTEIFFSLLNWPFFFMWKGHFTNLKIQVLLKEKLYSELLSNVVLVQLIIVSLKNNK